MSRLKHIINGIIWTAVIIYFVIIAAVRIPFIQSSIGAEVSDVLEKKLGTRVVVTRVDVGFLNRLIIDGVVIYDKNEKKMLRASRLAAKINYYELLRNGRISISSAQIFGMNGSFYCKDEKSEPNYQFLLDSLASKDTTKKNSVELSINSLIIRHGAFTYDRYDIAPTKNRFNTAHVGVKDISAHFIVPYYGKDGLIAEVKKLSFKEQSGIRLEDLVFRIKANKTKAEIEDFELKSKQTVFYLNTLNATYKIDNGSLDKSSLSFSGNIGKSVINLSDFSALLPAFHNIKTPLVLSTNFNGTGNYLHISRFNLHSKDNSLKLTANGSIRNFYNPSWFAAIRNFECNMETIGNTVHNNDGSPLMLPEVVRNLGLVSYKGHISGRSEHIETEGSFITDVGVSHISLKKTGRNLSANVNVHNLNLLTLTGDNRFGTAEAALKGSAVLAKNGGMPSYIAIDGVISHLDYNGYPYQNIMMNGSYDAGTFAGLLSLDDPNGQFSLEGNVRTNAKDRSADVTAKVRGLDPAALHLSDKWKGSKFDLDMKANINIAHGIQPTGNINVEGLTMTSEKDVYRLDNLVLEAEKDYLSLNGDFGHAELCGRYDIRKLVSGFTDLLHSKLPTLFPDNSKSENDYSIVAQIDNTEILNRLFNIPLTLKSPMLLSASVNDHEHHATLDCRTKALTYDGGKYENVAITAHAPGDTLFANIKTDKVMGNGHRLSLNLDAVAADDCLLTTVKWNNNRKHPMVGTLSAETSFKRGSGSKPDIHVRVLPSEVMVSDTVWHVLPADIKYSGGNLSVDNFSIEHNRQHIRIDGLATRSRNDSITVDLQDVDVSYVLNLVNFHSVDFSGLASGKAYIKSVFFEPDAYADLRVNGFRFENGRMGDLKAFVNWNKTDKQIDINARAEDKDGGQTLINGFVSPPRNEINLGIEARNTNLEFLESFCGTFLGNINARGTGSLRVAGPLDRINLTGLITAGGSALVKPLNVTYTLENDTVRFIPDNIIFSADTIRDRNGNIGIIDGTLHHEHLTRLTYDLKIQAHHLLCYDTHEFGDDVFYGTAYGTGLCGIQGGNGRIDIDVDIRPEKNSFIEYNAASPESISGQDYITWHDATPDSLSGKNRTLTPDDSLASTDGGNSQLASIPSDLRINFMINMTPDATLRVLMDRASGDYIALNGTGSIRATYFNKGSFDMFGTYLIDHGLYKLTIQNIIKKEFQFQQGGTITFGGDPYNAALNLKALYTVNGVPLSDLRLGRSFSSSNVRVDCMMNITGTPQAPKVDFDLDLPTVNADAKQMIKTIINGEQEMNQQVVYLLSVGRFYIQNSNDAAQEETRQSQTSLAMQSLLSGTISQQINSVLGSLVKNNNWSFGANISTGDEGFNNAEYEGLLQGRLLNNRLLINGQFGYRDNANATTSFIGDFDISYLLLPSGNLAIKVYNQTNDRYFTKSSLNTQGIGLMMKKDFNTLGDLFGKNRKRKSKK